MSFLRKIFPFLFKSESSPKKPANKAKGRPERSPQTTTSSAFGLIARNRNARGLRKGSRVYVRSILEDGDRLRVRGTAPNGQKVTITVPRRSLADFESEPVPDHIARHYDNHSLFKDEHEAKMKAEALGKH